MSKKSKNIIVNVIGETCPVPLVETRKALRKAKSGAIIEVVGDHQSSKKEIPMAVESLGLQLLDVKDVNGNWKIIIKNSKKVD
jgi:TusA-related sulfurtransferase